MTDAKGEAILNSLLAKIRHCFKNSIAKGQENLPPSDFAERLRQSAIIGKSRNAL